MLSTGILTGMHVTKHGKSKLTNCYNKILGMHVGFFPLEYAGELHIIALKEEELGQNSHTTHARTLPAPFTGDLLQHYVESCFVTFVLVS